MEYIEGETLSDRLARGALPPAETLRYGIEIAEALDRAHRAGIVHRDLKPGNVMLTKSGVKLLDFGLAKLREAEGLSGSLSAMPTVERSLTAEGSIVGTLQYMAPEQLEGKTTDARTDIFALGAVLYEMATGRKAFSGSSQASLISAILRDEPRSMRELDPSLPAGLDRIVRRALAKDPDRRWQSARDLAFELEDLGSQGEEGSVAALAGAAHTRRFSRAGWTVSAVLLLLLAAAFLAPWRRKSEPAAAMRFTIPPPSGAAFTGMLALSRDGHSLAFVATGSDGKDLLWIRPLDSLDARSLEGTEGAAFPFWSPDSRTVAFFAQGKLKKVDVSGGTPQVLCDVPGPRGGSWGSREIIVFAANTGGEIDRVPENGGQPSALPGLTAKGGQSYRWPFFLPDGEHFLVFAFSEAPETSGIYVASLEAKEKRRLIAADGGAVFAAPGYLLFRSGDRLVAQPFDAGSRRVTGAAFPVVDHVAWDPVSTLVTAASVSDTGLLACQTGGSFTSRLVLCDRSGRELRTIGPPGYYWEPAFSPDGRWLAVARTDPEKLVSQIWAIDLERNAFTRVSSETTLVTTPLWSPDGRQLYYSSFPSGGIYVRDARAAENGKLLFRQSVFTPLDDLSQDGRYLFYEELNFRTSHTDIGVRDLESDATRILLQDTFDQSGARLSSDGRWLAYQSNESGIPEIVVRRFPTATDRWQVSSGGGTQPRWREDGKELFYVSSDRKIMAVDIRTEPHFAAGKPRALFQTRILPLIEARNHYDVTRDGQRFVVNSRRPEDATTPMTVLAGWEPRR